MDLSSGRIFSADSYNFNEIILFDKIAAFGCYTNFMFYYWMNAISNLGGRSESTVTVYVYDCPSLDLLRNESEILDLVNCCDGRWRLDNYSDEDYLDDVLMVQLMHDSIFVSDLSYYHNRSCNCDIHHKTLYGYGGRLRDDYAVSGRCLAIRYFLYVD